MDALLMRYLMDLLSKRQFKHIPFYTCRLKSDSRRQVCCALLLELTRHGTQEARQTALEDLDMWLDIWKEQQLGDVQPDELRIILGLVRHPLLAPLQPSFKPLTLPASPQNSKLLVPDKRAAQQVQLKKEYSSWALAVPLATT